MMFDGRAVMQQVQRFRESDAVVAEAEGPLGERIRFRKHPAPGIALRIEGIDPGSPEVMMVIHEPGDRLPEDYPAGLPFVPGLAVAVMLDPVSQRPFLSWWGVPDAFALADRLVELQARDGWEPSGGEERPGGMPIRHLTLRRGFEERIILASALAMGGVVQLMVPGP